MIRDLIYLAELDLLRMIEPLDVEYPCVCRRCGSTLSVYRPENTTRVLVQDAAAMIHRNSSRTCSALDMQVLDPYPNGPRKQEEECDRGLN